MLKSALATLLLSALVAFNSGCCCLSNWYYQGTAVGAGCGPACGHGGHGGGLFGRCGHLGGGCGDCGQPQCDSCDTGCGGGCGLLGMFGWGCGEKYWGDWHAGDRCEPCDQHGNWTGGGYYPAGPMPAHDMPIEYGESVMVMPEETTVTPARSAARPTPAKATKQPRQAY